MRTDKQIGKDTKEMSCSINVQQVLSKCQNFSDLPSKDVQGPLPSTIWRHISTSVSPELKIRSTAPIEAPPDDQRQH